MLLIKLSHRSVLQGGYLGDETFDGGEGGVWGEGGGGKGKGGMKGGRGEHGAGGREWVGADPCLSRILEGGAHVET